MTAIVNIGLVVSVSVLIRCCISLNKYSGAGIPPLYGDFEAQRHWMEITYNLPIAEWYVNTTHNDLQYWGLDYPPLTAYHSWLCGYVANYLQPDWVALNESHGIESPEHKLFMRYTVLLADVLVYFSAAFLYFATQKIDDGKKMKGSVLMMLYPGLMLIDHGHFQYNCVSLGLVVFAVLFLGTSHDILGSMVFCLALNYKQMELYHAFPFFCYLLGSCLKSTDQNGFLRLLKIGIAVVLTFVVCWLPFLGDKNLALQVLHRLFPFGRGLYEDKVANVWCSLSVLIKLKNILTVDRLILVCLGSTLLGLIPSSLDLLIKPSIGKFKIALVNSSLIFFLLSFQVHEKSILIPAVAVCMLIMDHPLSCLWFLLISTFSMLPLLIKDGLLIPYCASMILYYTIAANCLPLHGPKNTVTSYKSKLLIILFYTSLTGSVLLMIGTVMIKPPPRLPDLFPVLISVYSCLHFLLFLVYFHYLQFTYQDSQKAHHHKVSVQDQRKKKH